MLKLALTYLILINVVTFCVYALDKQRARKGKWRVSEATLVMLAIIGGSLGALLAMFICRHKTRHTRFIVGIPAILLAQLAIAFFMLG